MLDFAVAKLAVTAGLLLVAALRVGFAADGFAIGNLGRFQRDFSVVALLEAADDGLNVRLAGAGNQELVGLRIAEEANEQVLFHELVNGGRELVFVGAALGLDGVGHGRLGQSEAARPVSRAPFCPSVSPVSVSRSLATAPRSPACSSATSTALRPCITLRCEKLLLAAARVVLQGGVVLDHAADHLEEGDAAGEGIGHGFEDDDAARARCRRPCAWCVVLASAGR